MPSWIWVVIAIAVVAVLAVIVWQALARRRTSRLQQQFGPEYDRALSTADSKRDAEAELQAREERRQQLEIRPLSQAARDRYLQTWQGVQAQFVDDPRGAVASADSLIQSVMAEHGYPVEDFEQRAADISVDHPQVVENYRYGHRLAQASADGSSDSTEDLRQAMRHYRALFDELVEPAADQPATREQRNHQLSTRDLAARSDSDEDDRPLESQQPAERSTGMRDGDLDDDSGFESAQSDESLTRDPAAAGHASSDTRAADSGVVPAADGGRNLDSSPGDTGMHHLPGAGTDHEPLFATDQSERFTSRWQEVQTSFVDQPREAVAEADALVADLMQRLAASFSQERERLEAQWDRGDDVSTEDLRVALTRYRSFFDRLLSA